MVATVLAEEQIRSRAYEIHLKRGCQPGHDRDDWLQAEYELLHLPVRQIAELQPPKSKWGSRKSLVSLVQAALLLGTKALSHHKG